MHNLGSYRGTGGLLPFVIHIFEWGVIISTLLSVLRIVPCCCACLADFLHPKLRKIDAGLITLKPITVTLQSALPVTRLRGCAPSDAIEGFSAYQILFCSKSFRFSSHSHRRQSRKPGSHRDFESTIRNSCSREFVLELDGQERPRRGPQEGHQFPSWTTYPVFAAL